MRFYEQVSASTKHTHTQVSRSIIVCFRYVCVCVRARARVQDPFVFDGHSAPLRSFYKFFVAVSETALHRIRTGDQPTWMTPPESQEALLHSYIGKFHTPRTKRDKSAKITPAHKKQPQDLNQEAPGSGSSRLPRRLRRAYFTEVRGRSA